MLTDLNAALPHVFRSFDGRLLGIDAGGSSTRVIAIERGHLTELPDAEPMNALLTVETTEILGGIISRSGATAAGIGVPGIRSAADAHRLGEKLTSRTGCRVLVSSDVEAARLGAFLGGPGIVVASGTGSNAFGSDGERTGGAGGHGFILGDEGSAYWIGREAVRAALQWADHMGGSERVYRTVQQVTGTDLGALVNEICSHPTDRGRLTVLAPVITALAADDPAARRIAEEAAWHLAMLAEGVRKQLGPLPVAGVGGVFHSPLVWDLFARLTGASRPMAPPAVGAAMLVSQAETS